MFSCGPSSPVSLYAPWESAASIAKPIMSARNGLGGEVGMGCCDPAGHQGTSLAQEISEELRKLFSP